MKTKFTIDRGGSKNYHIWAKLYVVRYFFLATRLMCYRCKKDLLRRHSPSEARQGL